MGQIIAPAASLASLGFGIAGDKMEAKGAAEGSIFEAERAMKNAEFGRLQAEQTDTQYREELGSTLAHINTIRAASGVDPSSPTTSAILGNEQRVSDRQRINAVYSLEAQARESDKAALYRKRLARQAIKSGQIKSMARVAKAAGDIATSSSMPGRSMGSSAGGGGVGVGSTHTGWY